MSIAKHSSQLLPIDIADISLITVFNNLIKINTVIVWQAINRAQAQKISLPNTRLSDGNDAINKASQKTLPL
jgi:hypothetical protein